MLMLGVAEYHLLGIIFCWGMPQARFLVKCHFLIILFIYSQHALSHYISSLSPSYVYLSKRQYPELVSEPEAHCPRKRLASSWRRFRRSRSWRMIYWGRISAMVLDMGNIRSRIAHRRVTSLEVNYNSLALLCSKRQRLERCRLHSRVA